MLNAISCQPERPMSAEELAGKFADCAQGLIADDAQRQVIETIYGLDEMESINSLTSMLKG